MPGESGVATAAVPDPLSDLPGRLRWAIERQPSEGRRRGIRLFQDRMRARAVEIDRTGRPALRGYHLSSIQGYLSGDVEPSLHFLREAADLLGVRLTWLVSGDGQPTDALEAAARLGITAVPHDLEKHLTSAVAHWPDLGPRVRGAIAGTWAELLAGRDPGEQLKGPNGAVVTRGEQVAGNLGRALTLPLGALGLDKDVVVFAELETFVVILSEGLRLYSRAHRLAVTGLELSSLHLSEEDADG